MSARSLLALFVLIVPAGPAAGLEPGGSAVVAEVVDGDTVVLEGAIDGARDVRLVGIQAPKLPLGRPGFPTWPLADDARRALEGLALGRRLNLGFGGQRMDRHGRLLAHLHDGDGVWMQGEMLRRGMARVYSFADNRALVADMLALERDARGARRGIWALRFYAVRTLADVARHIDTFQIVEGAVRDAAQVRGRVYLNFGADWRTDFTVTMTARVARLFRKAGRDPLALEGQSIRVRGWLKRFNGPMIEATHPEQVEVPAS